MMGETIARRVYTLSGGTTTEVVVEIQRPVPDQSDYRCDYSIGWPDGQKLSHAMGVDSVQALVLALKKLAVDISTSDEALSGRLTWLDNNDNFGL